MTYPTYQAAKIANPDCNIYTHGGLFSNEKFNSLPYVNGWRPCNPADYCMTVRQFLDAGHKFVEGDIFLNLTGNVKIVTGSNVWLDSLNCEDKNDKERYILEAKALKETKTYRYEKVTDSIFDLKAMSLSVVIFFQETTRANTVKLKVRLGLLTLPITVTYTAALR